MAVAQQQGQLMPALMAFLFPKNLEHPESTGRMDVFAWSAALAAFRTGSLRVPLEVPLSQTTQQSSYASFQTMKR